MTQVVQFWCTQQRKLRSSSALVALCSAVVALWSFLNGSISPPCPAPSHRNCSGIKQNSKLQVQLHKYKCAHYISVQCSVLGKCGYWDHTAHCTLCSSTSVHTTSVLGKCGYWDHRGAHLHPPAPLFFNAPLTMTPRQIIKIFTILVFISSHHKAL